MSRAELYCLAFTFIFIVDTKLSSTAEANETLLHCEGSITDYKYVSSLPLVVPIWIGKSRSFDVVVDFSSNTVRALGSKLGISATIKNESIEYSHESVAGANATRIEYSVTIGRVDGSWSETWIGPDGMNQGSIIFIKSAGSCEPREMKQKF